MELATDTASEYFVLIVLTSSSLSQSDRAWKSEKNRKGMADIVVGFEGSQDLRKNCNLEHV